MKAFKKTSTNQTQSIFIQAIGKKNHTFNCRDYNKKAQSRRAYQVTKKRKLRGDF